MKVMCRGHTNPEIPENRKKCLEVSLNETVCPEIPGILQNFSQIDKNQYYYLLKSLNGPMRMKYAAKYFTRIFQQNNSRMIINSEFQMLCKLHRS